MKKLHEFTNFISLYIENIICLIQESAESLFYYLFKISIFVANVFFIINLN
jgi:hypothetical protein